MRREFPKILAWTLLLLATRPVRADDSSAALAAGGIVFTKTTPVRMAAEDLYVSPKRVRIRFVFANDTGRNVETLVAFPLPDIDTAQFWASPVGSITTDPANFIGFEAHADGKPIAFHIEQRAFVKDRDVTALLAAKGLPVNPLPGDGYQRMEKLSPAIRQQLIAAGVAMGDAQEFVPQWVVRTKFYWRQIFPAHKNVIIEHSYQPVTGQSFFSPKDMARSAKYQNTDYCFTPETWNAIGQKSAASRKTDPNNNGYLTAFSTDYILQTANNWHGAIGRFHLTLDKLKPDAVLSLCWNGHLQRTGPTTFEETRANFVPAQDIHLLVLE